MPLVNVVHARTKHSGNCSSPRQPKRRVPGSPVKCPAPTSGVAVAPLGLLGAWLQVPQEGNGGLLRAVCLVAVHLHK